MYNRHAPAFTRPPPKARAAALAQREAEYARTVLARVEASGGGAPAPDRPSSGMVTLLGTRQVPGSADAARGAVDPRALTLEARAWLRDVSAATTADSAFWAQRAPGGSARLWSDASVPDAAFAADAEVGGGRQLRPPARAVMAPSAQ